MRARLGPKGLILLRHMAEHGSITPRDGGALLQPEAMGTGHVRGAGRGNTDARGVMNRAAGALLGHMVRAGWAVPSQGERYAVAYSITDAGREAARVRSAELEADPLCGPADPIPLDRKRCNRCGRARKRADFHRDGQNGDGLGKRCRFCGSEEQAERRAGLIVARDADAAWQRASKEVIVLRCLALIRAARVAKRAGTWRGRDGLRAYIDLGKTLDLFSGNGQDPAVSEAEACDPGDNTKPHHCDPCDSNWNRAAHSTPEHLRRRMAS